MKNVTYAFLYGAGDVKIGLTYDKQLSTKKAKEKGQEIRAAYIDAIPGLADLLDAAKAASDRGYVKAIDGRKIILSSPHVALNYLLQGSAGVIAKRWMVIAADNDYCCSQLAFVHDELQYECATQTCADLLKSHLEATAAEAGSYYNLRIPIACRRKDRKQLGRSTLMTEALEHFKMTNSYRLIGVVISSRVVMSPLSMRILTTPTN